MLKTLSLITTLALLPLSASADSFGSVGGYAQYRNNDGKNAVEIGVGGSVQVNNYIDFRGIASLIQDGVDDKLRLNIGLVDLHTSDESIGVRLGRIQHELGFSTAQYNWAPSRDMYLPPQGIYRENFRYMVRSGDGIQLYTRHAVGPVYVQAELMYSHDPVLYPMKDITKVWNGIGGEIDTKTATTRGMHLAIEAPDLHTTIRYDQQRLNYNIINATIPIFNGAVNTTGHYFGSKTELSETVDMTLEYMIVQKDGSTWETMDTLAKMRGIDYTMENAVAYGASMTWQATSKYKFIGGVSAFYSNPSDKHGKKTAAALGGKPQDYYTEDVFVGAKYRYNNWISTLELHHTRGTTTMLLVDAQNKSERNNQVIFTVTHLF